MSKYTLANFNFSNFTKRLYKSYSPAGFLLAGLFYPQAALAVCPTSTPASNSTVNCTFTVDGAGDAIYDNTGIQAAGSTGVTLNIDGTIPGEIDTGGITTLIPPAITLGSGARIAISDAEIASGDFAAIEAQYASVPNVDFDNITNRTEFETTFGALATLADPIINYPGATIQLGAPMSPAAIQVDIDRVIADVTTQKRAWPTLPWLALMR